MSGSTHFEGRPPAYAGAILPPCSPLHQSPVHRIWIRGVVRETTLKGDAMIHTTITRVSECARLLRAALSISLLLALQASSAALAVPPNTVHADGLLVWPNGDTTMRFGPNTEVAISTGALGSNACPTASATLPTARIYVVPSGTATPGASLSNIGGPPHTVLGLAQGGGFVDASLGSTAPSGRIGTGTYPVVYNVCQDGIVGQFDSVFDPAFSVFVPVGAMAPLGTDVGFFKASASNNLAALEAAHPQYRALFDYIRSNSNSSSPGPFNDILQIIVNLSGSSRVSDPKNLLLTELASTAEDYVAIIADPPDAQYQQVTQLRPMQQLDPETGDPLIAALCDIGTQASTE